MRLTPDRLISVATTGTFIAAGAFAFISSYSNIYDLCVAHGGGGISARLTPLSVDVLILAASLGLLWATQRNAPVPWPVRAVLVTAVAATIAGNMLYGLPAGPIGAARAAWPGFAFVATIEILMWLVRAAKAPPSATSATPLASNVEAARAAYAATLAAGNPLTQNQLQERYKLTRAEAATVRKGPESAALTVDPPQAGPRLPSPSGPLVPVNGNGRVHA